MEVLLILDYKYSFVYDKNGFNFVEVQWVIL